MLFTPLVMRPSYTADLILRAGLAFALLFSAANAFFDPHAWIAFLPTFVRGGIFSDSLLLHTLGIVQIVLGFWLLSGRRVFVPALGAAVLFTLATLFNLGDFQVLFRDLAIAAMALSLAATHRPGRD